MAEDNRIAELEKELQQFRKDFADISANLKEIAGEKTDELQGRARRAYRRASNRAQELWDDVASTGQDVYERAGEQYDQASDAIAKQVRHHPLQTLAVVAGVGFLVGFLTRR